jgi:hypothetical protein
MPYIVIGPPPASPDREPSGEEPDAESDDQECGDDAP